jgi:hypothetical protein
MTAMKAAMQARDNENMPYARRRWLILATVAIAQLMIVLDLTIVNVALPSAQRSLHFATVDRQWVVTAYALAFGSLLLLGGRLAGRKVTFMADLAGFAVASAVGGASVNFAMLVTARACQGAFAAVMAPSALSILANTFADPKDRGKAFAVFGAIAGAGASVGLLLGGALTEYLSWRWTLYVNLLFAGAALAGAAVLLTREPTRGGQRLDPPGAVLVGGAMFCLVYGFANAATHSWHAPSTWGFLAAAAALAAFAARQARAKDPLLPPRVVLDRNRGGAYPRDAVRQRRRVRDLPVPRLLPADHPGVLAAGHRPGVPALPGGGGAVGQCRAARADVADRAQAADRARPADRGRRHGLADQDRRPFRGTRRPSSGRCW